MSQSTKTFEQRAAETRTFSIKEGAGASVMTAVGEAYLVPYALELQATNVQIGLLASVSNLAGPLVQLFGSRLIERFNRRAIILVSVALQASSWIFFIALGGWYLYFGFQPWLIPLFICSYILYASSGALGGPAWFSLLGDVVPETLRSRYFAQRNKILAIVSITATLVAATVLEYYHAHQLIIVGFIILCCSASLSRSFSGYYLSRHFDPPLTLEHDYYFSFWHFIKNVPAANFNRFAVFVGLMNFGLSIAGPFFTVYLWHVLKLSPVWFTLVSIAPTLYAVLALPWLGRFADRYGNRELLRLSVLLLIPAPLFWFFSGAPLYLILLPQLITGVALAAFNLAASNFIFDSVSPQQRAISVAYYNLINGIGIFSGALLGGFITQVGTLFFTNVFFVVFAVAAGVRLAVVGMILPTVHEVRHEHHPVNKNPLQYLRDFKPFYAQLIDTLYPLRVYRAFKTNKKGRR